MATGSRKAEQTINFSFDTVDFKQLQAILDRRVHFRLIQRSMNEAGKFMNRDIKAAMRSRYAYKGAPTKADIKPVPAKGGQLFYSVFAQFRRLPIQRFRGLRPVNRLNRSVYTTIVKGRRARISNAYVRNDRAFKRVKGFNQKVGFSKRLMGMSFYSMYRAVASDTGGGVATPSFTANMNRVFAERLRKLMETGRTDVP